MCDEFEVEVLQNFGVAVVVESYCQPLLGWHVARYLSLKIFSPPGSITILILLLITVVIFLYILTLHSTLQHKQVALPSASIAGPNILSIRCLEYISNAYLLVIGVPVHRVERTVFIP